MSMTKDNNDQISKSRIVRIMMFASSVLFVEASVEIYIGYGFISPTVLEGLIVSIGLILSTSVDMRRGDRCLKRPMILWCVYVIVYEVVTLQTKIYSLNLINVCISVLSGITMYGLKSLNRADDKRLMQAIRWKRIKNIYSFNMAVFVINYFLNLYYQNRSFPLTMSGIIGLIILWVALVIAIMPDSITPNAAPFRLMTFVGMGGFCIITGILSLTVHEVSELLFLSLGYSLITVALGVIVALIIQNIRLRRMPERDYVKEYDKRNLYYVKGDRDRVMDLSRQFESYRALYNDGGTHLSDREIALDDEKAGAILKEIYSLYQF